MTIWLGDKRKFRHLVMLVSALICAFVMLSPAFDAGKVTAAEEKSDMLTVGVPLDRCPVFYKDEKTGEITGIGVDLMRTAAESAGYEVEFQGVLEGTLKEALDNTAYDLVMPFGSAIASAAGKATIVSENLMETPFTLVTAGNHDLPDISALRVGMLRSLGGAAETVSQHYPGIEIIMYDSMPASVNALRAGDVDALLHNSYVWSYMLQKPSYSDLSVQPSAMFSMDFRAGAQDTAAGREIMGRLNGGIAQITDPLREAVILDYTTRRLYRYDIGDYLYEYRIVIFLAALLFIALTIIILQGRKTFYLEHEQEMMRMIDHDLLTGAYSLNGFRKRAEELIRQNPDTPYMLFYSNIRNFKYINALRGKSVGDDLLRYWVDEFQGILSETEVMGRIESDHFAVLRKITGDEKLDKDMREAFARIRNYFVRQGEDNLILCCSGIYVLTPKDYQKIDVDRMLDFARVAEKRLRDTGVEGHEFYNPEQWEIGRRIAEINSHLSIALASEEVEVWYQPQVDYKTGRITGAEALCRWHHPHLEKLGPSEFIPVIEKSGLIYELDSFIWERACRDLQRWNAQGIHKVISVNLSRNDMRGERDIPEHFRQLVETYGLSTDQLRIEITESAYVEDHDLLLSTTARLRALGFQVEMDDFGSGYSSLHMLKEVTVDRIKLDLQFLYGTGDAKKGRIIVGYMTRMVRELGMDMIVEGVENKEQADFLQSCGCYEMQGFYFYKPMPVREFEALDAEAAAKA